MSQRQTIRALYRTYVVAEGTASAMACKRKNNKSLFGRLDLPSSGPLFWSIDSGTVTYSLTRVQLSTYRNLNLPAELKPKNSVQKLTLRGGFKGVGILRYKTLMLTYQATSDSEERRH